MLRSDQGNVEPVAGSVGNLPAFVAMPVSNKNHLKIAILPKKDDFQKIFFIRRDIVP
jgi:hypothetical protein